MGLLVGAEARMLYIILNKLYTFRFSNNQESVLSIVGFDDTAMKKLRIGARIKLSGGYDTDPPWLSI